MIFCQFHTLIRNMSRILQILHNWKSVKYQLNISTINTIKCTISCFQVQSIARTVLSKSFLVYKSTQRIVIPELIPMMTTPPPKVTEEQFKVPWQILFWVLLMCLIYLDINNAIIISICFEQCMYIYLGNTFFVVQTWFTVVGSHYAHTILTCLSWWTHSYY